MKLLAATLTASLAPFILAAPATHLSGRQGPTAACANEPNAGQIGTAINNWRTDVTTVNAFLNAVPPAGSPDLVPTATDVLAKAKDEPVELMVFAAVCELNQPGMPDYFQAVQTLMTQFSVVITSLQNILDSPGDQNTLDGNVQAINQVRCCAVLPSLDVLWPTAAENFGLVGTVQTDVPRESACAAITC